MTQFPILDRILHKSFITDMMHSNAAMPIVNIVAQAVDERTKQFLKEEKKDGQLTKGTKGDFLSHFIQIQATNPSIPPW